MTAIKLRIMVRACRIRMAAGEALETVLDSYTGLSAEDRAAIEAEVTGGDGA